jgi:hypothetical protein
MKRNLLVFGLVGLSILLWFAFGWAQQYCGDSLYVKVYPPDTLFSGSVRVPLYVSHYRYLCESHGVCDSIHTFDILLSYTHTNPTKYCSLSYYWNNTWLYPSPDFILQRSMFRHFISPEDDTLIHNWMMDLSQQQMGLEWNFRQLALYDSGHFELAMYAEGGEDQLFGEASNVLLATMTFRVEDTMTICLDEWPYHYTGFAASCTLIEEGMRGDKNRDTLWLGPKTNLPYCFSLSYPARGDVNVDGIVNVGDMIFLINYLFMHGPPPVPLEIGDANCDGVVDIADVVYLVNYLFMGGPEPSC